MQEHPIIFSTPMVQAIMAERKTQTRRIIKPQPIDNTEVDGNFYEGRNRGYVKVDGHPDWQKQFALEFCQYGQPGDFLWVRETWAKWMSGSSSYRVVPIYKASEFTDADWVKWTPSIHMPKKVARIWLKIISVRVEKLQQITKEDAIEEGIYWQQNLGFTHDGENGNTESARLEYFNLWEKINGKETSNPWVWVVEFKVVSITGKSSINLSNLEKA